MNSPFRIDRNEARTMVTDQMASLVSMNTAFTRRMAKLPKPKMTKLGWMRHMKRCKNLIEPISLSPFRATASRFECVYLRVEDDEYGNIGLSVRRVNQPTLMHVRRHALDRAFERCGYRDVEAVMRDMPLRWSQLFNQLPTKQGQQVCMPMRSGHMAFGTWDVDGPYTAPIISTIIAHDMLYDWQERLRIRIYPTAFETDPPSWPMWPNEQATETQMAELLYWHETSIKAADFAKQENA